VSLGEHLGHVPAGGGRHFPFEVGSFGTPALPVKWCEDCRASVPGAVGERGPSRKTSTPISSFPHVQPADCSVAPGFPVEMGQATSSCPFPYPSSESMSTDPPPAAPAGSSSPWACCGAELCPPPHQGSCTSAGGSDMLGCVSVGVSDRSWSHRACHKPAFDLHTQLPEKKGRVNGFKL